MTQHDEDVKAVREGIEKGFIEHRMGDELISIPVRTLELILDRLKTLESLHEQSNLYTVKLMERLEKYERALNLLACWDEGETVDESFDYPSVAMTAREALEGK